MRSWRDGSDQVRWELPLYASPDLISLEVELDEDSQLLGGYSFWIFVGFGG
jgi:hypothetical protein